MSIGCVTSISLRGCPASAGETRVAITVAITDTESRVALDIECCDVSNAGDSTVTQATQR